MSTNQTAPEAGHSSQCEEATPEGNFYCVTDSYGCNLNDTTYTSFQGAIAAAVELSHPKEDWNDPAFVVGFPQHAPELPPRDLREEGQIAAIVIRKVIFSPATGQALEPTTHPTPWGELRRQIELQSKVVRGLQDALSKSINSTANAIDAVNGTAGWDIADQVAELRALEKAVKQLDCPF